MPHVSIEVDRTELRQAMSELNALLACWTTEWDAFDSSEWWWTCCDHEAYDVERIDSAKRRRDIRKGLRECTIRRVAAHDFPRLAYPIYRDSVAGYGPRPPTESEYVEQMERWATYPGTEFWAAFHKDKMVAFVFCLVVDNAVGFASSKSAQEFHKYKPNSALFYSISRHYLSHGRKYLTNGWRELWHPTGINEFLEKLGFRKVFCRVHVELSPAAKIVRRPHLVRWGASVGLDRLFGMKWGQLEGFQRLVTIAETFK
jgi:hypothetical protein